MTVSKLALYNDALLLVGERQLSSLSEDHEPRYLLDSAWDLGATDYCLTAVKPVSQRTTVKLNTPATSSAHGLDSVHTLPSDCVALVGVYLDEKLDQPITRFIQEGSTIACEFATVYVRYVTNGNDVSTYDVIFAEVVSAYLARKVVGKIAPDEVARVEAAFQTAIKIALDVESQREPLVRSRAASGTLSADWINIYNDALTILGRGDKKITDGTNDSSERSILDSVVDAGLVKEVLEDTGWFWAQKSTKSDYDTNIDPDWGYAYAHPLPDDMHRLDGVFADEYMRQAVRFYHQEESVIYSDETTLYLNYVSSDFITTPASWPTKFKKLVSAKLAADAGPSIPNADVAYAVKLYEDRESSAMSADVMQSPPRVLATGSWVNSRYRGPSYRGRP